MIHKYFSTMYQHELVIFLLFNIFYALLKIFGKTMQSSDNIKLSVLKLELYFFKHRLTTYT